MAASQALSNTFVEPTTRCKIKEVLLAERCNFTVLSISWTLLVFLIPSLQSKRLPLIFISAE